MAFSLLIFASYPSPPSKACPLAGRREVHSMNQKSNSLISVDIKIRINRGRRRSKLLIALKCFLGLLPVLVRLGLQLKQFIPVPA